MVGSRRCRAGGPLSESLKFPPRYKFSVFSFLYKLSFLSASRARTAREASTVLGHLDTFKSTITKYLKCFKIVLENFRNLYFKEAFSDNPRVKHGQLAPFVVIITNYDMSLSRGNHIPRKGFCGEKVCAEKRFVWRKGFYGEKVCVEKRFVWRKGLCGDKDCV